jgi:hypothetical protein
MKKCDEKNDVKKILRKKGMQKRWGCEVAPQPVSQQPSNRVVAAVGWAHFMVGGKWPPCWPDSMQKRNSSHATTARVSKITFVILQPRDLVKKRVESSSINEIQGLERAPPAPHSHPIYT